MTISKEISNKFRNMSVVCALFVVMIHCRPEFREGSYAWWFRQFTEVGITQVAVPFFFLASGFFLLGGEFADKRYRVAVFSRIRTLVIPFFFWIIAYYLFELATDNISALRHHRALTGYWLTPQMLGIHHSEMPLLTPLWYMRTLFILVLMSPVLTWLIKKFGMLMLLGIFIAYGVIVPYSPMYTWGWLQELTRCGIFSLPGFFYFSLGIAFRIGRISCIKVEFPYWGFIALGLALVFLRAYWHDVWFSCYFGFLSIPILMYGIWQLVPTNQWAKWLVRNTFPIYVMHKFIMWPIRGYAGRSLALYLGITAFCFVVSALIAEFVRRILPRSATFIFGGR